MLRTSRLIFLLITFALAVPAWSASLDDARQLHEDGMTAEALATIESVLSSGATDEVKAEALDLLGTIAVEEGHLAMAKQAWTRLVEEYPEYSKENDTETKLLLASALLKTEEKLPVAEKAVPETATLEAEEPEAPAVQATPEAAPAASASTPSPAAPAPSAAPVPESTGLVLVAARGKPSDSVRLLSERLVEHLREQGVDAASATGGIPVVEDSKMVLPMLLQKGQQDSAESVLLLTADFVSMQKVTIDCYAPAGAKLWKVKTSGGTGWKGRPYSKTGITEELAERFLEKLDQKVGGPGLPVTLE